MSSSESEDDEGGGEPCFTFLGTAMEIWLVESSSNSGIDLITILDLKLIRDRWNRL